MMPLPYERCLGNQLRALDRTPHYLVESISAA
jgi:hypothetical protein